MASDTPKRNHLAEEVDRLTELVKLKDEELGRIEEARNLLYQTLQERESELVKLRAKKRARLSRKRSVNEETTS